MAPDLSHELASLAEPLSVVLHATRRASSPKPGQSVLILGCGAVGLLSAALSKSMGATRITVVDIDQAKLDFCKAQGWATETLLLPRGPRVSGKESLEAAKKTVQELFEPKFGKEGWDCVFECSGVEVGFVFYSSILSSCLLTTSCLLCCRSLQSCMQLGILLAKTGGKVAFVGMGTPEAMLPTGSAFLREVDLIGTHNLNPFLPSSASRHS